MVRISIYSYYCSVLFLKVLLMKLMKAVPRKFSPFLCVIFMWEIARSSTIYTIFIYSLDCSLTFYYIHLKYLLFGFGHICQSVFLCHCLMYLPFSSFPFIRTRRFRYPIFPFSRELPLFSTLASWDHRLEIYVTELQTNSSIMKHIPYYICLVSLNTKFSWLQVCPTSKTKF